ncbi:Phosphatidylinositol 5-phosphate 4-kinase type-2 beta [Homalodisca vitripennis]|nr:Phosphatidylinositol 5-phosphate 4-kinase type-2 beta [Homalodisca vitripennis]
MLTRCSDARSTVTNPRRRYDCNLRRSTTLPTSLRSDPKTFVKSKRRSAALTRDESQPVPDDSQGKSGAKFYQSYDRLFIIKTLTSEEVERMHSFLKQYHPYIVERHGKTLLPQYLGMYRLTVDGVEHYMVAMRNVFSNHLQTHRKFDLKGSTVDREASDKEKEKDLPTFKDNDFVKEGIKIYIGDIAKDKLLETLTADVEAKPIDFFCDTEEDRHTPTNFFCSQRKPSGCAIGP